MIERAAIKLRDGRVYAVPRPGRHHDAFEEVALQNGIDLRDDEFDRKRWRDLLDFHVQGFVTNAGEFVDRDGAFEHAAACGQKFVRGPGLLYGPVLTSEDIW